MSGNAHRLTFLARAAIGWLAGMVACTLDANAKSWPSVPPEQLATAAPIVDRQADAEALFWDVRIEDSFSGNSLTTEIWHHVRIKVFTERGKQSQSRIDLPYAKGFRIDEVSARALAPDGRVTELAGKEVRDRVILKGSGLKVRAKSFLVPGVEVGSIVEYRWREFRGSGEGLSGSFLLQRDVPCQRVTYRLKPLELPGWSLAYKSFNRVPSPFTKGPDGYQTINLERVPAFVEEADMPPELEVRAWIMIYYLPDEGAPDDAKFWNDFARGASKVDGDIANDGGKLKGAAAQIAGDAVDPVERLRRLYEFCRTSIRNLSDDVSGLTDEQRDGLKEHKSAVQTYQERSGTWYDVNRLYAALASGLGFRTSMALLGNREVCFFRRHREQAGMLTSPSVAVRVGNAWRFYDPGSVYVPHGMLRWQEEDQDALVSEKNSALWLETPLSPGDSSRIERSGGFRLLADGTLEGDARVDYYGHAAVVEKERNDDLATSEREKAVRTSLEERMPGVIVDSVHFEHVTGPDLPMTVSYHLRIPGFAEATGKRLFFRPAVFQQGLAPRFKSSTRSHPVYFHYLWNERDSLTIDLPEGYELDQPEAPTDHVVNGLLEHQVRIGTMMQGRRVVYRRFFGLQGLYFKPSVYDQVKAGFDASHERDQHSMAVRLAASGSAH